MGVRDGVSELAPNAGHEDEFPAWAESKQQMRIPADWSARRAGILEDWRPRAEGIGVPTLLIRGGNAAKGAIVSGDIAAEAQRLNPKIGTVCFAQAGHNPPPRGLQPIRVGGDGVPGAVLN